MKFNKLGFLSILALLGFLGFTVHRPLLGFFGFAYYLRYFFVTPDEMFRHNVRKAASIGFFSGVWATGLSIAVYLLFPPFLSSNMVLASCYVVSVFCFTIALLVLEMKEQWED
ncbi:DUF3796 domain-containing protein [Kineothrix sedimenti]|uniref:DUF3796 domain-containing protein n=1 Tax=Kineothrix sedimenti TaxID=3123317 RepID=A0ABZ3F0W4_9FIRM